MKRSSLPHSLMTRRELLAAGAGLAPRPAPPNLILILADDLGWRDVGYEGTDFYETPNIDRMARQGMTFTQAYSAAPLCSATRAAIMTGKSPARLHITGAIVDGTRPLRAEDRRSDDPSRRLVQPGMERALALDESTIAEVLKQAGYATGFFGKWHLGDRGFWPEQQGFDVNFGGTHLPSPPSYFYPYRIPNIESGREGEYLTDRLTTEAERFVAANAGRPFFLCLWHYAVHTPLQAKPELVGKYRRRARETWHNPVYAAMIDSLDQSVGRLLAKLDQLRIAGNTLVVFTSDNGGLLARKRGAEPVTSNAPLRGGKEMLYEGGIRVPLVVRWPGRVRDGSRSQAPVVSTDLFFTLAEAGGARREGQDGLSLLPLFGGAPGLRREALYWHFPHYMTAPTAEGVRFNGYWNTPNAAIRKGRWKLLEFFEGSRELYDLEADPGEARNAATREPHTAQALGEQLRAWLNRTDAWLPVANPRYQSNG